MYISMLASVDKIDTLSAMIGSVVGKSPSYN